MVKRLVPDCSILFLNFCLLATISVPDLAQGPLPTPSRHHRRILSDR
jgi:hypothetical protein